MSKYRSVDSHKLKGEVNTMPSLTVPDQALSVRAILERYVRGQSVENFPGVYTDSDLVPDGWERMDVIERTEYARAMKDDLVSKVPKRQKDSTPTPAPAPVPVPTPKREEPTD